ncbi:MAG: hypothetical protein WC539_04285 [Nitrospirota bacterium]
MNEIPSTTDLEKRIAVLEEKISCTEMPSQKPGFHPLWAMSLTIGSLLLAFYATGFPRHYYPVLFGLLLLLLLYHRGILKPSPGLWRWPQIIVNGLLFCMFFHFLIGGGITHPFEWLKLPVLTKAEPQTDASWYSWLMPDYSVQWQGIPKVSEWSIDLTKIQTFLLLAAFAGGLFRFEPFTSIAVITLLLVSLPAYLRYQWDTVFWFLILGSVSIYIQSTIKKRCTRNPF